MIMGEVSTPHLGYLFPIETYVIALALLIKNGFPIFTKYYCRLNFGLSLLTQKPVVGFI
jgi:hypothetical protein